MQTQAIFSETAISELFSQVWKVGTITSNEHQNLINAMLANPLSSEEEAALKRLSHAIRRGWLEVID